MTRNERIALRTRLLVDHLNAEAKAARVVLDFNGLDASTRCIEGFQDAVRHYVGRARKAHDAYVRAGFGSPPPSTDGVLIS